MDVRKSVSGARVSSSMEKTQGSGQFGKRMRETKGVGNTSLTRRTGGNVLGAVFNTETLKEKQVILPI